MSKDKIDISKIVNIEVIKAVDMECKKIPKTIKPTYATVKFIPLVVQEFIKLKHCQKVKWHGVRATIFYKNGSQVYILPKPRREVTRNGP